MKKKKRVPGLNTTSTADISFMLLIFFLVTSSMDTDKGLPTQLPPPEDELVEKDFIIKERNVLTLQIDENDHLTCNQEDITTDELTLRVEEFVANTSNDPKLPEMSTREVHLMGKCQVSDRHIISIQVDRHTSYNAYLDMKNAVVASYHHLRNRLALRRFGHPLSECTPDEHNAITIVYPQRISEQPIINSQLSIIHSQKGGRP